MPKIPVYEQQVAEKSTGGFNVPTGAVGSADAFGAGMGKAIEKIGNQITEGADKFAGYWGKRQKEIDEHDATNAFNAYQKEKQDMLFSKDADANGRPIGILNRKGDQAREAGIEFDQVVQTDMRPRFMDTLTSDGAKESFAKMIDHDHLVTREALMRHEVTQLREAEVESLGAFRKQNILGAAAFTDARELSEAMKFNDTHVERSVRLGMDRSAAEMAAAADRDEMAKNAIGGLIERDPMRAQKLFNGIKGNITEEAKAKLQNAIDGKVFTDQAQTIWSRVSSSTPRLADGSLDERAIATSAVEAGRKAGLPADKLEKLDSYVRAKAGEAMADDKREKSANDNEYLNQIVDLRKKKGSLDDAFKVANSFGASSWDEKQKRDIAEKLWKEEEKNVKTDPVFYVAIMRGVEEKSKDVTPKTLYDFYQKGKLSGADFIHFNKELMANVKGDKQNDPFTIMRKRLEIEAEGKYSKANLRDQYLFEVDQLKRQRPDMTPSEFYEMGKQFMDKDPNTGWLGMFKKDMFRTAFETQKEAIPAQARIERQAMDELRRAGKPITQQNLDEQIKANAAKATGAK